MSFAAGSTASLRCRQSKTLVQVRKESRSSLRRDGAGIRRALHRPKRSRPVIFGGFNRGHLPFQVYTEKIKRVLMFVQLPSSRRGARFHESLGRLDGRDSFKRIALYTLAINASPFETCVGGCWSFWFPRVLKYSGSRNENSGRV